MNFSTKQEEIFKSIATLIGKTVKTKPYVSSTLYSVFKEIVSGECYSSVIEQVRSIDYKNERQEFKRKNLPFFTIGEFRDNERQNVALIQTQYAIFDYDHLPNWDDKWSQVISDSSVFAAFRSPSGDGIKIIYKFDKPIRNAAEYSTLYKYYAQQFSIDLGKDPDTTSDCSRPCYMSYDPDIYINTGASPLLTNIDPAKLQETKSMAYGRADLKSNGFVEKIRNGVASGDPRTPVLASALGILMDRGIDRDFASAFALGWNRVNEKPHTEEKILGTVNDMYDRYENDLKLLPVVFKEQNNSYFKTIKVGKEFTQIMITSFKIIPKELLVMETSDCLKCDIQSSQGNYYENVLIENTDWHTKQKFLKSLGHQDCVFLGSENDLQALCQFTQVRIPIRKTGTKIIGLHEDVWVVEGINIIKTGKEEAQKIVPFEKGSDAFYHKIRYQEMTDADHQYMLGVFYDNITNINKQTKIFAYLGWLFATPLKPKIDSIIGAFPLLFVHGSHGSGKTSMSKIFARLVGYSDPIPNSVTLKTFPLLKMLSSTNAIPQWYDEFKVADMREQDVDNILRFMRKAYAGEVESKGRADQTVENYKISAPMAVMGEWNINQPAIMERVIIIRLNDEVKKNFEMRRAFNIINEIQLEGFMPKFIEHCLNVDAEELFESAQAFVSEHFRLLLVAPRVKNNLAVMIFGLELLREYAHNNKVTVPNINYGQLLDDQLEEITGSKTGTVTSAVDQLMEELSIMAEKSEVKEFEDYKMIVTQGGLKLLAINFKKVFRGFKVYAKKTNYEGDLLDEMSYNKMFDDCEYVYNKNMPVKIALKTQRCLCIDVEKATTRGVVLDGFENGYNSYKSLQAECNLDIANMN